MRQGNACVVLLCSLAMAMQVELRSVVAATGQSSYGSGVPSTGAGAYSGVSGSNAAAGMASAGSGSSMGGGFRMSANGGSEAGGFYGRGGSYSSYNHGGYSPSSGQNEDQLQKETKYYYGGKYQGSCVADGLYYRDDTTFVICSNGYPHEQPCPPGTKTSGSPRYQAGYYYGYTDLCSVNLVDYGYGPEYYAPRGYPEDAAAGPGRELQGAQGNSRSNGAQGQGSSSYGGLSSGSGASASANIGSAGSPAYDRSRSYGVRESDFAAQSGLYGSAAAGAGLNKNRPYDVSGSGYNGKKDTVQASNGYNRDPSGVPRPSSFGFGDIKSPSAASSPYQLSSAADSGFASKSRDVSAFSLSKSAYFGSSDKKYV